MTDSPKRASTSSRMNPIWLNASTLMNMSWWFCIADLFHPQSHDPSWFTIFISMESVHSCSNSSWYTDAAQEFEQKAETSRLWNSTFRKIKSIGSWIIPLPHPDLAETSHLPPNLVISTCHVGNMLLIQSLQKGQESAMNDLGFHCWGFVQKVK